MKTKDDENEKENEYEKKEEDDGVKNTVRYIMTERFFSNCEIFLS